MLLEFPFVLSGQPAVQVGELSKRLAALHASDQPSLAQAMARQAAALELASVITSQAKPRQQADLLRAGASRLAPVLGYIQRHLHEPMPREMLAGLVHLSPSAFYRLFRDALGERPAAYISRLRLERAQQLLTSGDLGVQEVAHRSGFADAFHFSRTFKGRFGHSPLEYRRRVREWRL
jgi:transcriptional regulator GlxA family with amidase domain